MSPKLNTAITCHLSAEYYEAIKNIAFANDVTASQWLRELAEQDINNRLVQAQNTIAALGLLAISQNDTNSANFKGAE